METIASLNISEELIAKANAIPNDQILEPRREISGLLADCKRVTNAGKENEARCIVAGLREGTVKETEKIHEAFRSISALLEETGKKCKGESKEYDEKSAEAGTLRLDLFAASRHALRKNPVELEKLKRIQDGTGKEDQWFDFEKLAFLGESNVEAFVAIGFDTTKFAKSRKMAKELPELFTQWQYDKQFDSELCVMRNRIYTLLITEIIEIRDCGKYAFRDKPEIQKYFNFSVTR